MSTDFNLDVANVDTVVIDNDTAKLMMQVEQWHQAQCDNASAIINMPDNYSIKLGDMKVTDPAQIAMFKAGVSVALDFFKDLPFNLTTTQTQTQPEEQ